MMVQYESAGNLCAVRWSQRGGGSRGEEARSLPDLGAAASEGDGARAALPSLSEIPRYWAARGEAGSAALILRASFCQPA